MGERTGVCNFGTSTAVRFVCAVDFLAETNLRPESLAILGQAASGISFNGETDHDSVVWDYVAVYEPGKRHRPSKRIPAIRLSRLLTKREQQFDNC